jgi:hypothetical protein
MCINRVRMETVVIREATRRALKERCRRLGLLAMMLIASAVASTPSLVHAATSNLATESSSSGVTAAPDPEHWRFTLVPYLWLLAAEGDTGVGNFETDLDVRFGDIVRNLSFAVMVDIEVHRGRLGFFADPLFAHLKNYSSIELLNRSLGVNKSADMFLLDFGLSYRIWEGRVGQEPDAIGLAVEPFVGARYFTINLDIDVEGRDINPDEHWIAPILGLCTYWDVTKTINLRLEGDIGGFGVSNLDFTWQAIGLVGFRTQVFQLDSNVLLGYRALGQNFDDGNFKLDATFYGPVIGLAVSF